jgi:hypothetical protein
LLYQARCNEKLGNLVRARELYIKLARENLPADAPQVFRAAQKTAQDELPAVEARVPYVTIVVKGEGAKDASVTVDGTAIPKDIIGLPYPINPGPHKFAATGAAGFASARDVTIEEGQKTGLELVLTAGTNGGKAPVAKVIEPTTTSTATVPTTDQPSPGRKAWMKPTGYVAVGVGVVGAALGTVMYFRGSSKSSDADDAFSACSPECSPTQLSHVNDLDKQANTAGILTGVGYAVGGVGLVGGITLLLLAPKQTEHVAVVPWISPNSVGLTGRF